MAPSLLDKVPAEIWAKILGTGNIADWEDVENVTRVCHVFRNILLPFIFVSHQFRIVQAHFNPSRPNKTTFSFSSEILQSKISQLKTFATHQVIPGLVKSLTIDVSHMTSFSNEGRILLRPSVQSLFQEFAKALCLATLACENLLEVKLLSGDLPLQTGFLKLIFDMIAARKPKVEHLKLYILFLPDMTLKDQPKLKHLLIDDKSLHRLPSLSNSAKPPLLASPAHLQKLVLFSFGMSPTVLAGFLVKKKPCSSLKSLAINIEPIDFPILLKFLSLCPAMTQLHVILTGADAPVPSLHLDLGVVPLVGDFLGPMAIARVLAPGRPMKSIQIFDNPWTKSSPAVLFEDLRTLSLGSAVERLDLTLPLRHGTIEVFTLMADLFPGLVDLRLTITLTADDTDTTPEWIEEDIWDIDIPRNADGEPEDTALDSDDTLEGHPDVDEACGYKKLVYDIALGQMPLPSKLQKLMLALADDGQYLRDLQNSEDIEERFFEPFTYKMGKRIAIALGSHLSDINYVKVGFDSKQWPLWLHKVDGNWQALKKGIHGPATRDT